MVSKLNLIYPAQTIISGPIWRERLNKAITDSFPPGIFNVGNPIVWGQLGVGPTGRGGEPTWRDEIWAPRSPQVSRRMNIPKMGYFVFAQRYFDHGKKKKKNSGATIVTRFLDAHHEYSNGKNFPNAMSIGNLGSIANNYTIASKIGIWSQRKKEGCGCFKPPGAAAALR